MNARAVKPGGRFPCNEMINEKKALIAMSGGVDSSVAAYLTLKQGYSCVGVTMRLYDNALVGVSRARTCCSLDDIEDAYSAALRLGIPFHVCNLETEFKKYVMEPFAESYLRGETPNPCIACNRFMKFELLHEHAYALGCETVVTGHYARIAYSDAQWHLYKALDGNKDQSYVLYNLTQDTLAHTLFPLGELRKDETRRIAESLGFKNAAKPDSQDICFAPDGDYAAAVERISGESGREGNFVDANGNVLGRHKGIVHYTVGQRRGLGVASSGRLYVARVDAPGNTIVLGSDEELYSDTLTARDVNWISGFAPDGEIKVKAKIRYSHAEQEAAVLPLPGNGARVVFEKAQRAITAGQSVVFYDGDEVLGGGIICDGG